MQNKTFAAKSFYSQSAKRKIKLRVAPDIRRLLATRLMLLPRCDPSGPASPHAVSIYPPITLSASAHLETDRRAHRTWQKIYARSASRNRDCWPRLFCRTRASYKKPLEMRPLSRHRDHSIFNLFVNRFLLLFVIELIVLLVDANFNTSVSLDIQFQLRYENYWTVLQFNDILIVSWE